MRLDFNLDNLLTCEHCAEHLELGARPIFQINPSAKILIAGQAPGLAAHLSGIPFDDASGRRLRNWLDIDEEAFYRSSNFAILPMGFCYPGRGRSGDLPPRPECAPLWRERILSFMPNIELTLVIGQYAKAWHLPESKSLNLTETVADWRRYWPDRLPLSHPSPRNNIWLKKNQWFEQDVVPALRRRVKGLINAP